MFYGASANLFQKAKRLRENMTPAEQIMWERLKENHLKVRFKPQHPIDIFIADFYCHELKLIIEIDAEIRDCQTEKDESRSSELSMFDINIIRLSNKEVFSDIENVIDIIKNYIMEIQNRRLEKTKL